jgi:TonB-dependent starch-binding outer membrane protein SusC
MKNIHFKTCTCLLGILLILFSGIQVKGASLEVQQESKVSGTVTDEKGEPVIGAYHRSQKQHRLSIHQSIQYRQG